MICVVICASPSSVSFLASFATSQFIKHSFTFSLGLCPTNKYRVRIKLRLRTTLLATLRGFARNLKCASSLSTHICSGDLKYHLQCLSQVHCRYKNYFLTGNNVIYWTMWNLFTYIRHITLNLHSSMCALNLQSALKGWPSSASLFALTQPQTHTHICTCTHTQGCNFRWGRGKHIRLNF